MLIRTITTTSSDINTNGRGNVLLRELRHLAFAVSAVREHVCGTRVVLRCTVG